jgi:hypothetical protein
MNPSRDCIESISVALEIVAFFCVTLDLYGKERLNRATIDLLAIFESISTKIRRRVWEPFEKAYQEISKMIGGEGEAPPEPLFVVMALMLVAVSAVVFIYLFGLFGEIMNTDVFPPGFFKYVLMVLIVAGLLTAGFIVTGYAFMALLISFRGLLLTGLYLLTRLKFQGISLGFGTLCFLFSKGLILWLLNK